MDGETYGIGILWGQSCLKIIPYDRRPNRTCRSHLSSVRFLDSVDLAVCPGGKQCRMVLQLPNGQKGQRPYK
jgi:hypothetical protein